ncbi:MAG: hypothetical protein NTZ56_12680 [Acidobacteria bacterium]|nr:hypothetical protein [Acidobacteriota bacterium]
MKSFAVITLAATLTAAAAAQPMTLAFSDPSRPGTVRVELTQGSIHVTGAAGNNVILDGKNRSSRQREESGGMRRIGGGGANLNAREEGNVIRIDSDSWSGGQDVSLQVPFKTSLVLKTVNGGTVRVENVEGEIEVQNVNGSIRLVDVAGTVVANSSNGKVEVTLSKVTPGKPMAFTSLNGTIDVTFPPDLKATMRMRADNGDIFTDFEAVVKTEQTNTQNGKGRWRSESTTVAQVGGGGPEIRLQTMNGRIYIRKGK